MTLSSTVSAMEQRKDMPRARAIKPTNHHRASLDPVNACPSSANACALSNNAGIIRKYLKIRLSNMLVYLL